MHLMNLRVSILRINLEIRIYPEYYVCLNYNIHRFLITNKNLFNFYISSRIINKHKKSIDRPKLFLILDFNGSTHYWSIQKRLVLRGNRLRQA